MKRSSTYFQFIKFSVVGTFGFGVDVCVFYLFTQICNLGLARIIAFLVAVIFLGQQAYEGVVVESNISNMAHIIGGIVGAIFGFLFAGSRQEKTEKRR